MLIAMDFEYMADGYHENYCIRLPSAIFIMLTCPCNVDPLTSHVYIEKYGVYRDIHFFLILALKYKLLVHDRTTTIIIYVLSKIRKKNACWFVSRTIFQSCWDAATTFLVIPVLSGSKASCSRTQHNGCSRL